MILKSSLSSKSLLLTVNSTAQSQRQSALCWDNAICSSTPWLQLVAPDGNVMVFLTERTVGQGELRGCRSSAGISCCSAQGCTISKANLSLCSPSLWKSSGKFGKTPCFAPCPLSVTQWVMEEVVHSLQSNKPNSTFALLSITLGENPAEEMHRDVAEHYVWQLTFPAPHVPLPWLSEDCSKPGSHLWKQEIKHIF